MNGVKLHWPSSPKVWAGLAVLTGVLVSQVIQKDWQGAGTSLAGIFGLLGLGGQTSATLENAEAAKKAALIAASDTTVIRNDPTMPGPPLTPGESAVRRGLVP